MRHHDVVISLFLYGTLQHGLVLKRLLGRLPDSSPATLAGHRAAPLTGRAYPGLLVDTDSIAGGRLITVTEAEAEVLDRFEGPEYERRAVTATDGDGVTVACAAWLLTGPSRRLAQAGAWDLAHFLATDAAAFLAASTAGDPHPGAGP